MTTRPEYSGARDLSYSAWHRAHLPSKCYVMNLDWVEFRSKQGKPVIVALIEDKDDRAGPWEGWKRDVMLKIASALHVPAYLVYHNVCHRYDHRELWKFRVVNLVTGAEKVMPESEYRRFVETLGSQQ